MERRLPPYRYLDYYLVVSDAEFLVETTEFGYNIIKKDAKITNVRHTDRRGPYRADWYLLSSLTGCMYEAIANEMFGLKSNPTFQRYLYQHSIYYHPEISKNWYRNFYANPFSLVTFIKENLQCLRIDTRDYNYYLKNYDKTLEIVQVEVLRHTFYYDFELRITYQNIFDISESYSLIWLYNYRKVKPKILAYAKQWHKKQEKKKKELIKNKKKKEKKPIK